MDTHRADTSIAAVTPAEVPVLLELIRELARFERLEHEVESTVELLHEAFFGPRPAAGALLARWPDHPRVDLIIECIGGTRDASELLEYALDRGRTVVTANKDLIAT